MDKLMEYKPTKEALSLLKYFKNFTKPFQWKLPKWEMIFKEMLAFLDHQNKPRL